MEKTAYRNLIYKYLLVGAVAVGLVFMDNSLGWFLLSFIAFYVLMIVAALPHELGHAFVARAVGFHPLYVVIGFGRTAFERRFCGFKVLFKSIPLGGAAFAAPKNTSHYKVKECLVILAGPLANLAVAGLLVFYFPDSALNFDFVTGIRPVNLFFIANLVCFAISLWPRMIDSAYGRIANDGLLIWKTLFLSSNDIKRATMPYFLHAGAESLERREFKTAFDYFDRGLSEFPEDTWLLSAKGSGLLFSERFEEAREIFRKLLERPEIDLYQRSLSANNLAYVDALIGGEELIREADKYSKEALECIPTQSYYKGTRGCVLVELGQYDEGIKLLKEAMEQIDVPRAKAADACHIAIAEKRRGNLEESQKFADVARDLDPDCKLLKRLA